MDLINKNIIGMKGCFCIAVFVLLFQPVFSQWNPDPHPTRPMELNFKTGTSLNDEDFERAKQLYLKMSESQTYIDGQEAMMNFASKCPLLPRESVQSEEDFQRWVTWNLDKTKFASIEEALEMRSLAYGLVSKYYQENEEVYALIRNASMEQVREIFRPMHNASRKLIQK